MQLQTLCCIVQLFTFSLHFLHTLTSDTILQHILHSAKRFQHIAAQSSKPLPGLTALLRSQLCYDKRQQDATEQISEQCYHKEQDVHFRKLYQQYAGCDNCNQHRRNRMCIKHLQCFNITGDQINQISLILPLQPRRSKAAQNGEYPIPQNGKQLKCNIVVAGLFPIM